MYGNGSNSIKSNSSVLSSIVLNYSIVLFEFIICFSWEVNSTLMSLRSSHKFTKTFPDKVDTRREE